MCLIIGVKLMKPLFRNTQSLQTTCACQLSISFFIIDTLFLFFFVYFLFSWCTDASVYVEKIQVRTGTTILMLMYAYVKCEATFSTMSGQEHSIERQNHFSSVGKIFARTNLDSLPDKLCFYFYFCESINSRSYSIYGFREFNFTRMLQENFFLLHMVIF